ncbi:MAG: hypothetical protein M9962_02910 [Oligoflexia bacterium]|nr:hypothetical protein [Oligoflexia bacterium]
MADLVEYQNGLLWMRKEGNFYILGFTQLAIESIGSPDELELIEVDDEVESGGWIGELKSRSASVALLAPEGGKIVEINEDLIDQVQLVEDDPTGDAWAVRMEIENV